MKKTLIASLLVAVMAFASCNRTGPSTAGSPSPALPRSEAQAQAPSDVLILFSGLMVFHETKENDRYEVGILRHVTDHKFTISVDGTNLPTEHWPKGSRWTLEVRPDETSPTPPVGEEPIKIRRPDDRGHQYDFGWIIDLEEFHPDLPELDPGHLDPIIQLPYGKLSTKHKSYDLMRWQGGSPTRPTKPEKFGFVPETIELALKLRSGQELFLRDEQGNEVKLNLKPTQSPHEVVLKNVSDPYSEISDFHHYYELFKDWPQKTEKHYHFRANKDKDRFHPNNPFPGYNYDDPSKLSKRDKITCCMMACTAVRTRQLLK